MQKCSRNSIYTVYQYSIKSRDTWMAVNENRNKKVMFEHMTCLTKSSWWLKILQIAQKLCKTSIVGLKNGWPHSPHFAE